MIKKKNNSNQTILFYTVSGKTSPSALMAQTVSSSKLGEVSQVKVLLSVTRDKRLLC